MSQYDIEIHYIKGEDNLTADALSRRTDSRSQENLCATLLTIGTDPSLHDRIREGYKTDPWCQRLDGLLGSLPGL
jgi:hypothetical protein